MWKNNNNPKMHGISEIGPNVPAFLVKLWKLVEDPECDLIYWSESGMSFIIVAQARFAREVLPLHYKHNNMASFIRQLNMYDFHKIASFESGGLRSDKDELEFAHQYFIKGHPYLLENIKRKLSSKSGVTTDPFVTNNIKSGSQADVFAKVLSDVNILKGKQESWDARLTAMKRENEALWRELAIFRQKHLKQEQIINKLIHFIVTIVQPSRKVPLRRRFPLMLNDTQQVKKITKMNGNSGSQVSQGSPVGPTIHEIDSNEVLINSNGTSDESISNVEYISSDFSETPAEYVEVVAPEETEIVVTEPIGTNSSSSSSSTSANKDQNPADWLEIVLTEDNMITNPLTPIDPAKVNPTVAAATLKHLENTNKITAPIRIKIPSVAAASNSAKKKTVPEKKIIYLTEVKKADKIAKKRHLRQGVNLKIEPVKNKGSASKKIEAADSSDLLLDMISKDERGSSAPKILTVPYKGNASGKRKLLPTSSSSTSSQKAPIKRQQVQTVQPKIDAKAASKPKQSLLTPVTLEKALKRKLLYDVDADDGKDDTAEKDARKQSDNSFWKLDSLYNGSIGVGELVSDVDEDEETVVDENETLDEEVDKEFDMDADKETEVNLCDIDGSDVDMMKSTDKSLRVEDIPSESMAVACQSPSATSNAADLSRELSSHVDNVQGEIDYLKEVLKGEGYNFDMNSILGLFNDDPLSYGVLPPADEESKEKENEKGITGSEVITYGTPPNLMDLVDLFGSTGTVQDWTNILSPTSPTVSELTTPAPSPSPAISKSGKRRKI